MSTKKQSGSVLVYDRYYAKKPAALIQAAKKTAYCCALCVCCVLFLADAYDMPVNYWAVTGLCVLFCTIFCAVFTFFKKRFSLPVILFASGVIIWQNYEALAEKISYFSDIFLLALDGQTFKTKEFLYHGSAILDGSYGPCAEGVLLGMGALSFVFALITAASFFRKPVVLPSFAVFAALCAPLIAAVNLKFSFWIIPAAALFVGGFALTVSYTEGAAVKRGGYADYVSDSRREEREFRLRAAKAPFIKGVKMNGVYYSKFLSSAMCAAAMFLVCAFIASRFLPTENGVDYSAFYDFINGLGEGSGITSPFESGPVSEYFTNEDDGSTASLNIISPGNGNQEILRVNSPDAPVYLRGDFGIDLVGNSWSSSVTSQPARWSSGNLARYYRPAEMRALKSLSESLNEDYDYTEKYFMVESDITVEYLCRTNVVFLPAYTTEFGYYSDEQFDLYSDFTVRVNKDHDKINTVLCSSLIPVANYNGKDAEFKRSTFLELASAAPEKSMHDVIDAFIGRDGIYDAYLDYVYDTYLGVPSYLENDLKNYLSEELSIYSAGNTQYEKYANCVKISDYLMDNYTYSLDAPNNRANLVSSFLFETKSGHCALYASAMTLLLRELGIPARYCTGFVAPKTEYGEFAVLYGKNLHAWVEAYFDDLGWITFDPTSSALDYLNIDRNEENVSSSEESSESSDSSSESSSSEASSEQSSHYYESSLPTETSVIEEPAADVVDPWPFILSGLGAAALIAAVVIIKMRLDKFNWNASKMLKKLYKCKNAERVYTKILKVLELCGISPAAGELPEAMFARAEEKLNVAVTDHEDVLMKAAFGKDCDDAETAILARLLEALYKSADETLSPVGRFKLRRVILSKSRGDGKK